MYNIYVTYGDREAQHHNDVMSAFMVNLNQDIKFVMSALIAISQTPQTMLK